MWKTTPNLPRRHSRNSAAVEEIGDLRTTTGLYITGVTIEGQSAEIIARIPVSAVDPQRTDRPQIELKTTGLRPVASGTEAKRGKAAERTAPEKEHHATRAVGTAPAKL